jgi:hypothetical protein
MRRILLAGDVHGEAPWFGHLAEVAEAADVDAIVQLGDFGYWEHRPGGGRYLRHVAERLAAKGLWCDGFWTIRPNLFYAPRGLRWTWAGVRFLAMGGAYSIDKRYRVEGESWWPEETITEGEVVQACEGGPVDVLLAHDAPWGAEGVMGEETVGDKDSFPESEANRRRLRAVVDAVTPSLLVHGHYHHRNTTQLNGCRIEGLGRDGSGPDGWMLLDLADVTPHLSSQEDPYGK